MPEKLKELCSGCRRGAGAPRLLFDGPPNCAAIRQPRGRTFGRVADEWQHSRTQGRRSGAEPTRRRTVALWGLRPGRRAAVSSHPALASSPVAARPLGQTGTKWRSRSRVVHNSCGMPATGSKHAGFGPWPEYCRSYAGEPRRPRRPGPGGHRAQQPTSCATQGPGGARSSRLFRLRSRRDFSDFRMTGEGESRRGPTGTPRRPCTSVRPTCRATAAARRRGSHHPTAHRTCDPVEQ
jgi:hypothetical protein